MQQQRSTKKNSAPTVGTLSVFDPDVGDTHTFTVSDDRFEGGHPER